MLHTCTFTAKENNYMYKRLMGKVNNVFTFLCYLAIVYCIMKVFIAKQYDMHYTAVDRSRC